MSLKENGNGSIVSTPLLAKLFPAEIEGFIVKIDVLFLRISKTRAEVDGDNLTPKQALELVWQLKEQI